MPVIIATWWSLLLGIILFLYLVENFTDHIMLFLELCYFLLVLLLLLLVLDGCYLSRAALELLFFLLEYPQLLCVHLSLPRFLHRIVCVLGDLKHRLIEHDLLLIVEKLEFNVFSFFFDELFEVLVYDLHGLLAHC